MEKQPTIHVPNSFYKVGKEDLVSPNDLSKLEVKPRTELADEPLKQLTNLARRFQINSLRIFDYLDGIEMRVQKILNEKLGVEVPKFKLLTSSERQIFNHKITLVYLDYLKLLTNGKNIVGSQPRNWLDADEFQSAELTLKESNDLISKFKELITLIKLDLYHSVARLETNVRTYLYPQNTSRNPERVIDPNLEKIIKSIVARIQSLLIAESPTKDTIQIQTGFEDLKIDTPEQHILKKKILNQLSPHEQKLALLKFYQSNDGLNRKINNFLEWINNGTFAKTDKKLVKLINSWINSSLLLSENGIEAHVSSQQLGIMRNVYSDTASEIAQLRQFLFQNINYVNKKNIEELNECLRRIAGSADVIRWTDIRVKNKENRWDPKFKTKRPELYFELNRLFQKLIVPVILDIELTLGDIDATVIEALEYCLIYANALNQVIDILNDYFINFKYSLEPRLASILDRAYIQGDFTLPNFGYLPKEELDRICNVAIKEIIEEVSSKIIIR